jgi:creatinase
MERPTQYRLHNGTKAPLPFAADEYADRLSGLRDIMEMHSLDAVVLTSMHNVAYYSGFLYCTFGRPYACVVTPTQCVTISAGIDAGQPWRRSIEDNITYTDWTRDNFWRAVVSVTGTGKAVGCEADHLTMDRAEKFNTFLQPKRGMDIAPATMAQRMLKSPAEIALIKHGSNVADVGGYAIRDAIREGVSELEVSIAGRDAMEREIAKRFPDAEYRDTWVWFQSGLNTDGAHNPVTNRKLQRGDILSLNCEADPASMRVWQHNIDAHEYGMTLLRPGASCADITAKINTFLAERQMLQYRTFGYGHSFGILSHYYGREAALELREDIDTVLEPGMVISMEPMLTIPEGAPGAGGYREHDIFIVTEDAPEDITHYPYGPAFNVVG